MSESISAASWGAIIAGAFVAASLSVVLFVLGSGLGFASISPWPHHGISAAMFTATAAIWLIVMQWIAAGIGGYITGRLRTKWVGTHIHEVFFRDTAHGLVMWSVATMPIAAAVSAASFATMGRGAHAASIIVSADDYRLDALFRAAGSASSTALSMLIGAFIASVSAVHGGRVRDLHL